jgi:hypothetical protein
MRAPVRRQRYQLEPVRFRSRRQSGDNGLADRQDTAARHRLKGGMGDIAVAYLGSDGRKRGTVRIDDSGVTMLFGKRHPGRYSWDQVRRISFDDPGRTKPSIGAIAVFGVLGLAGRQAFSLLTISVRDQDLFFETQWPIGTWRTMALRIIEDVPAAAGRVFVDGTPIGPQARSAAADDVLDQIRKLGELRDAGVLTDEEFETKKAELLDRL